MPWNGGGGLFATVTGADFWRYQGKGKSGIGFIMCKAIDKNAIRKVERETRG